MKSHDMEIRRHRDFQAYWRMRRRSVVFELHVDESSNLSKLPRDIIREVLRHVDAYMVTHCFKRAENDERLSSQHEKQTRISIPNLRWLRTQCALVKENVHNTTKYWETMEKICAWDNISRWYLSGEGSRHDKQLVVYENTKQNGPSAQTILSRLVALFGPTSTNNLFVVRDINACGRTGTQVAVRGRGVPRSIIANDVLFANFSVLHGIDKRITPLYDTMPGNCIYM